MRPLRQMPERVSDECRSEQRLPQTEKRHGVHLVSEMQKGMSREGVEMKIKFKDAFPIASLVSVL